MVFWQVTVGRTVSGADRFNPCSFRFHHLGRQGDMCSQREVVFFQSQVVKVTKNDFFGWHVPWFVHHDVFLAQETFLHHPLVAEELRP